MKHTYSHLQNVLKGIFRSIPGLSIFFLLLTWVAGANAQINCATPLSGNYTINNTQVTGGTNFSSFSDFANALGCAGVSGPVVADVALGSGPYDEQPQFVQVTGASATNTITINGNNVRLTKNIEVAGGFSYATLLLNGADYLTVNDLKIEALGQNFGFGVVLMNSATFNTFSNCIINSGTTVASATTACVVFTGSPINYVTPGINGSNNLFTGCTLTGGHAGFSFYGDGANTLNNTNNRIENCTIKDYYQNGIILYVQDHAKVSGCSISRPLRATISAGNAIQVLNFGTNTLIEKNTIFNLTGAGFASSPSITAISLSSISTTPGNENIISNNLFYVGAPYTHTNSQTIGINCQNSQYVKILHNTIAIDQPSATGSQTSVSGIIAPLAGATIANNIVTINRGGTARKECMSFASPPDVCDNNDFFYAVPASSSNNNIAVFAGSTSTLLYSDPVLYKSAFPSLDQHSVHVEPGFVSPSTGNYAFTHGALNNIGRNVGVTTDITGASRILSNPDPGAYELSPAGRDASVQWVSPLAPAAAGLTDVKVLVTNNMATVLSSVDLSYSDGGPSVTQNFPINLAQGQSAVLTFTGQYNLTASKTFTVTLINVNGIAGDDFNGNNTAVNSICVGMSGNLYTVNSALPTSGNNFQTFNALVAALKCGGVAGPVTVTVSNGPYLEQVEIPEITGASATNRITIEGGGRLLTSPSFFTSLTNATSSGTTITVSSTASFYPGMKVFVTAGTGAFAPGTTIASITDATHFVVSAAPAIALTGANNAVTGFFNAAYTSAAGASTDKTVTVGSTLGLSTGMTVLVTAGTGQFALGTTVASIIDATHFEASVLPITALSGGATIVSGFAAAPSYASATGATSSSTTVTVASTAGLAVGMRVYVASGTGLFAANSTVASINANGTQFTVSASPLTALSGAVVYAFTNAPTYASAAGATASVTTVIVASTIGLSPGMAVFVTAGTGLFSPGTTISSITDMTHFVISAAATTPITGGSTVISALSTPNPLAPYTLLLSGADYLTVNNLVIENASTLTGSALACHLWNQSDNNIFSGCTFRITQTPALSQLNVCPFSISCSPNTSTGTNGPAGGSFNKVNNCDMFSGYYGVALAGATSSVPPIAGNEINNCTIRDAYATSMYMINSTGTVFSGNTIDRLTRTSSNNPYVGIQANAGCTNVLVEKNWIRNTWNSVTPTASTPQLSIEIKSEGAAGKTNRYINNIISDINNFNGSLTGFQVSQTNVSNLQIYHNTLSFDNTLATGSLTVTNGILCGSGLNTDIRNNIIYITRSGDGLKYGLYYNGTVLPTISNYNNIYVTPSPQNFVAATRSGVDIPYSTLAAYQAAIPALDQQSKSENPKFIGSGQYIPKSSTINDMCVPVGVLTDKAGVVRGANPDPGALEFNPLQSDAGLTWIAPSTAPFTPGNNTVTVRATNYGSSTITQLRIKYTDGVMVTPVNESFVVNIPPGQYQDISFVTPYSISNPVTLTATILEVNLFLDNDQSNDVAQSLTVCSPLSGLLYTIDNTLPTAGLNFNSFTDAVNRLTSCGISGPVVITVNGGASYVGQYIIPQIIGSSSTNTITIEGNGKSIIANADANPVNYSTLRLNGADWMIIKNLTLSTTGLTNGYACSLGNSSDNNRFIGCTFNASLTSTTATQLVAIAFSSSAITLSGGGIHGNNNEFSTCTISGGAYCISLNNTNGIATPVSGTKFLNCTIKDFHERGIYHGNSVNTVISNCIFERPNRTVTASQVYGIYITGICDNLLIERNRIRNFYSAGLLAGTTTSYGIFTSSSTATLGNELKIYSNLITNLGTNSGSTTGIYNNSNNNTRNYNNTISFINPALTPSGSPVIAGIQVSSGANIDVQNNIIYLALTQASGAGTKVCISTINPDAGTIINNNNLFNSSSGGTSNNVIGQNGLGPVNYATLPLWQAAFNARFDQQSYSVNPTFIDPTGNNYAPQNWILDNSAVSMPGLTSDILGTIRSSVPDMGAYEFSATPTIDFMPVSLVSPGTNGCYSAFENVVVRIKNNGNTTCDFSVTPVTITCAVAGGPTLTGNPSGTLASKATMDVMLSGWVNMSAPATYTFTISTGVTGDAIAGNNNLAPATRTRAILAAGTVSTAMNELCEGRPKLKLSGNGGGSIQWKESTVSASGPWTSVGIDDTSYTPASDLTQTTYYKAEVSCVATTLTSNVQTVAFSNNPAILTTTGAQRCGVGPVTMHATANAGSKINWYKNIGDAFPVNTGADFTVPDLADTTTYYAAASFGNFTYQVGKVTPGAYTGFVTGSTGSITFDALKPFTLKSVDVWAQGSFSGQTGTLTIALQNSAGVILDQRTVPVTAYASPLYFERKSTLELNMYIPAGTNYQLVKVSQTGITSLVYDGSGNHYTAPTPYFVPDIVTQKIGTVGGGTTVANYAFMYNWTIATGCESARIPVTATFIEAPAITAAATNPMVCPGSATQLNIVTSGNPAYSYAWTPGNQTGNSIAVSPSVYTNYTVTAVDNTAGPYAGCTALAVVPVSTLPKVSVNTSASPLSVCSGGNSQLAVAASTTASYAMSAATPSPVAAGPGITTLSKTNFPGNTGGLNDGYFTVDLPFDFSYFGISQNKIYINTNGFVSFANGYTGLASNSQVIIPHTGDADNAIYLAWKNWDLSVSGSIQYFTTGTAPHRIFVVKYVSVPPFVAVPPYTGNTLNGQIELYEDNGKIELFLAQSDNQATGGLIKTLGIENALGIGAMAPSQRNGTPFTVTSPEQWEFLPFGGSLTYNWTPNTFLDDASSTTPFASFIFSTTSFTATVTDASGGCSGSGSSTVSTGNPLSAPISVSAPTICAGQSTILSVTPTGGCAPYHYLWDDGNTTLGIGAFISVSPSTTTTYNLLVTDDFGTEYPFSTTITVNPVPVVTVTQGLTCGTDSATLIATGAATYSWSPSSNLTATSGASVKSFPPATTTYTVTGTTALGCQATALSLVTVSYATVVNITASSTAVAMNGSSQLNAIAAELRPAKKYYTLSSYITSDTSVIYKTRTGPGITIINSASQLTPNFAAGDQNDGGVLINLPFAFRYFGNDYSQMSMCTNGWVAAGDMSNIDATSSRVGLNLFTTSLPNRTMAAWFKDLGANFPIGSGSMRHGLIGPDIYEFQWDNVNANGINDGSPQVISYAVRIYGPASGTPGRIQYVYGFATGITVYGATIGIDDAVGGSDHYLNALNNSSTTSSTSSLFPNSGFVYEFTPIPASFSYAWTPSTFLNNTAISNPIASPMTATTTYTVTASNTDGCTASASVQVEVGVPLAASASSSGNNFCELLSDTLRAAVNGGCQPYTYSWSNGTTVLGSTKNLVLAPPAGTTTYTLTVTDACSGTATSMVTINVLPAPDVSVSKSGNICGADSAVLTATGASTYSWFPVNALNTEIGPLVTSRATVSTLYTVTGTGANGCKRPVTIQVNVYPAVKTYPVATPSTICVNDSSNLRANAVTDNGYSVTSINHNPIAPVGTPSTVTFGASTDESVVNGIPLPFDFDYFGNRYSTWSVSTNGYIGFGGVSNTSISQNFPLLSSPNNVIALCWADLNVFSGSSVTYYTSGTAPDRVFVISYNNVRFTGGVPSGNVTGKIQLYEGSNIIEMHITAIDHGSVSTSSNSMGIENLAGTVGYAPPGRNRGEGGLNGYNVSAPEAWRFAPVVPAYTYSWTPASFLDDAGAAMPLASNIASTTNFTVTVTNPATNCTATGTVAVTAGVPIVATGSALLSTTCSGDLDSLFVSASGGRAPYSYSWSDGSTVVGTANRISVHPLVTTNYVVTVTDYCGVASASAPVTIHVNPLPVLSVTPPGGAICNGLPSSISMTANGANSYAWSPSMGLSATTGASVSSSASASITYTVTGMNTTTGCINKTTATVSRTEFTAGTASATPSQVCASQASQLNSLFAVKTNPAILISEVTQFGAGTVGGTTPRPSYFASTDNNFIEISNLDNNPTMVGGLTFELWVGSALERSYTIPAGVQLQGHSVLVLHIGPGTNSPANNYYHAPGTDNPLSPTISYGFLLKDGSVILDAVATTSTSGNTYAWPAAAGVTSAQWTGTIPFGSINSVGVIRVGGFDTNSGADWIYATNSERQSLGIYNNGYASNSQPAFSYAWTPDTYLSDATLSNPVVSGSTGGTLNYTVTATDPASSCTNSASTTLVVTPLPTVTLSGPSSTCTGTGITLNFAFTGVGPWVYSYTDGSTVFGPYTSNALTATANLTPPGAAGSVVTYTPVSVSDSRCDGNASSLLGSAAVTLSSYSSIAGIILSSNKPFNNICLGDNITISMNNVTVSSLGTGAHWKWYTGSCNAGTPVAGTTDQVSITVNPTVTTTYYVRAEGTCNTTACLSMEVVVTTAPPSGNPGLVYSSSIAYAGASDSLVVTPVPGATFYHWTTNGNSNILFDGHAAPYESSSNKVIVTFVNPATNGNGIGNYHIQFFAGNACGTTNSNNIRIRATVDAPASVTGPLVACVGGIAKTYSVTPVVGAKSYQWTIGGGGGGTITGNGTQTVQVTFTALPATLCVHGVTAFGSAGPDLCVNITTVTAAPGTISGNPAPCQGGTEVYSIAAVSGAVSYNWTCSVAGAIITPNVTSASVQFPAGTFSGTVCVTANSGCASSAPTCLNVASGTAPQLGAITGFTEAVCGATSVNYQVSSIGASNYAWTVPIGASIVSGQGSTSILVDFTGTFTGGSISVISTSPCGNASQSLTVTGAPSTPVFTEGEIVACDETFGYTVTSNGATGYIWTVDGGDTIETANANNILVTWNSLGGSVTVIATNSCGNSAPALLTVTSNCRMAGSNSMLESLHAIVYPNPSQGHLTLQYNSLEESSYLVKVTDLTGRVLQRETLEAFEGLNRHEINLSDVAKGVYMLSLEKAGGDKIVIRLVIE